MLLQTLPQVTQFFASTVKPDTCIARTSLRNSTPRVELFCFVQGLDAEFSGVTVSLIFEAVIINYIYLNEFLKRSAANNTFESVVMSIKTIGLITNNADFF